MRIFNIEIIVPSPVSIFHIDDWVFGVDRPCEKGCSIYHLGFLEMTIFRNGCKNEDRAKTLLLKLGKTKEEVANTLSLFNIKGTPKKRNADPVCNYLTSSGIELYDGWFFGSAGWFSEMYCEELKGISDFVVSFNNGEMPEFIIEEKNDD